MLDGLRNLAGNPYLRNQLTLAFTGPRLGIAFLLVCGTLTTIHLVAYAVATSNSLLEPEGGTEGLLFAHFLALLVLLIVLLPIKAAGSFEGPRLSGVFDQIVATGVSPRLFTLGAWISGLVYAAMILVASLPFAACMYWLGNVQLWPLVLDYGMLLLYANVILALSLAASALVREWAAVPGTIVVLLACILFAVVPDRDSLSGMPEFFAEMTPARMLLVQSFPAGTISWARVDYGADPVFLFWVIPRDGFRIAVWLLLGALSLVIVAVGPGHRFRPGFNIFGTVATSNQGRFAGLLKRLRGGLTRRIELAFFYENAPKWTRRWGPAIRAGLVVLPVFVIWGCLIGSIYLGHPYPARTSFWNDELTLTAVIASAGVPILWALVVCEGRRSRAIPVDVGGRAVPRELFVFAVFAVLAASWFLLMVTTRELLLTNLAAKNPPTGNPNGLMVNMFDWSRRGAGKGWTAAQIATYTSTSWNFLLVILATLINTFLLSRVVNLVTPFLARTLTVIMFWVIAGVPVIIGVIIQNGDLPVKLLPIVYLSPVYVAEELLRNAEIPGATRVTQFLAAHAVLGVALLAPIVLAALWQRVRRPRIAPAAVAAGLLVTATLPAQDPPATAPGPVVLQRVARAFDGSTFQRGIDFFTVVVANPHDYPVRGEYWVEAGNEAIRRRPLFLSPKSTKTLRIVERPRNRWWRGGNSARFVVLVGDRRVTSKDHDLLIRGANTGNTPAQQHLFVDVDIDLPSQLLRQIMANNAQNATSCKAFSLPIEARMYSGVEVVWMTADSLQALKPAQRTALHRFALFGGTVMFTGDLPTDEIARTGAWEDLLTTTSRSESKLGDQQLRHVKLVDGRDVLFAAQRSLLNLRAVGAGHVGHLAFLPHRARTPAGLLTSKAFWVRFATSLPRSRYPYTIRNFTHTPLFGDWTSMGYLGVYLGLYSVLVAAALFFLGRRRKAQGLPLRWIAWTILFSACIPALVAAIRARPTAAGYFEYTWFGPASTRGVTQGDLRLRSAGKEQHRIEVHEADAFAIQSDSYGPLSNGRAIPLQPAGATAEGQPRRTIALGMPAWSQSRLVLGTPRTREQPIQISARRAGKAAIQVTGTIPADLRDVPAWAVWPGSPAMVAAELQPDATGKFTATLTRKTKQQVTRANRQRNVYNRMFQMPGHGMQMYGGAPTAARVLIVFAIKTTRHSPGMRVTSDDLDFEMGIPKSRNNPYQYLPRIDRDGRQRGLRIRRSVIFEVAIEQR